MKLTPCIIGMVKYKLATFARRLLTVILVLFILFYGVFTAALYIQNRYLNLLISPTPQVLIISTSVFLITSLAWYVLTKRRTKKLRSNTMLYVVALNLIVLLFCFAFTLAIQPPIQSSNTDESDIIVTTYNRRFDITDIKKPSSYIQSVGSDIVGLQEVSDPDYTKSFAGLIAHQYYIQSPDNDTGLTSRWPIIKSNILQNGSKQVIRAEIDTDQGVIVVYSVHITPPFSDNMYKEGLTELKQLQEWVSDEKIPVVVMGDFNTTIYAPGLRSFSSDLSSKIKQTTEQRWPQCSWYGHGRLQCLRIDFVYIPTNSIFTNSEISPDLGSDHRAITVRFRL